MRALISTLAILVAAPVTVAAQWTVSVQAGLHLDRVGRPQLVLRDNSTFMYSSPGEAPVIGLRATHWFRAHFGLDAGVALSQNRSWMGGGAAPLPAFAKRTVFTSALGVWRPTASDARLQLQVGLGPAVIFHGGTGESLLSRQTDFGVVGTVGAHFDLGRGMRLGLDVYNYRFTSTFADSREQLMYRRPEGNIARSEWLVLPSLRIKF